MAKNITVRDVQGDTHAELKRQAASAGLSLNRYLLGELERVAQRGRNVEIFQKTSKLPGKRPSSEEIVRVIREARGD